MTIFLVLLMIFVFIAMSFSSAGATLVVENNAAAPSQDGHAPRGKATAIAKSDADENHLTATSLETWQELERSLKEKSQHALETLTDTIDSRLTVLSEYMMSMEKKIACRTLHLLSHRLRIASQCFGATPHSQDTGNTLDAWNSQLYPISHYDLCAIQDLHVPQSRWEQKKAGVMEVFKPILEKRGHYLILQSFACMKGKTKQKDHYTSFGFYLNPSFNFQFDKQTGVETLLNRDGVGVLLITGRLFNKYEVIFACVRGSEAKEGEDYDGKENIDLITRTAQKIAEQAPYFYMIIGDFKLRHSVFAQAVVTLWRPILPDLCCESDILSEGSLLSSFNKHGYAQPDHLLTNMHIVDFRLFQASPIHRMRVETSLYPLKQTAIPATSTAIRKLNVELREDSIKF